MPLSECDPRRSDVSAPKTRLCPPASSVSVRDRPDVAAVAQAPGRPADQERARAGRAGSPRRRGRGPARRRTAASVANESRPTRPRALRTPRRVDDPARVDGRAHVAVAAGAGELERPHALHEERPLLGVEDRVALVDLDLERVGLDLAEVRVHRGLDRGRRRDAVLHARAEVGPRLGRAERRGRDARLVPRVGRARHDLESERASQAVQQHRRVVLEERLVGRQRRPRRRRADAAHAPPEEDAHPHVLTAREADALPRHPELDVVALGRLPSGALPDPVGRDVLAGSGGVEDVGLHAERVHEEVVRLLAGCRSRRG